MAERLRELHAGLMELIEALEPDVMAVEELFFSRNVTTALTVGQARGVILLAA
jgi:crossover junction endodeoxyribonuclease RuvC